MLVVEHRHDAAILAKDLDDLPKELVARILFLTELVGRIVAVLADDEDSVNVEPIAAAAQGLGDGLVNLEAELLGAIAAEIVLGELIDIGRDDIERRPMPAAIDGVAVQEA